MIVDTSAIVAILARRAGGQKRFAEAIAAASNAACLGRQFRRGGSGDRCGPESGRQPEVR